jgi:hypothetical protein
MKNHWLNRFRTGKRVRYKGYDNNLKDKQGYVVRVNGDWIDVQFEFPDNSMGRTKTLTVEKRESGNHLNLFPCFMSCG